MDDIYDKIKQIFLIYIIILTKLEILKVNMSVKIVYFFYKNNINLVSDKNFFINILNTIKVINNNDLTIFSKYLTFIFIIGYIDEYNIKLFRLINQSKLFKNTNNKLDLDQITADYSDIINKLIDIKNYLNTFEILNDRNKFFRQITNNKNDSLKKIYKEELLNRVKILCDILGNRLLMFIINKKNRKKKELISDYDLEIIFFNDLYSMDDNETIDYCFLLFIKVSKNIDSFIKDFEFIKYLKIIIGNYVKDPTDLITPNFHEKLIKKYVLI